MFKMSHLKPKFLALSVALAVFSVQAAEEQHAGDVQPWKMGTTLNLNQYVFEADFGDLAGGLFATDDPGYDVDTAQGPLTVGNWLRFQPVGTLKYWNGSAWIASVPKGERIEIKDALDNTITFTASGVSGGLGVIGAADNAGGVHDHIDMSIKDASGALGGRVGAYLIELNVYESAPNSEAPTAVPGAPIKIAFNRGLDHEVFDLAVDALENALFDDNSGSLEIKDVQVGQQHYRVGLQLNNDLFELKDFKLLMQQEHAELVVYDLGKQTLEFPHVKAYGKTYQVTMQNTGDFKFKVTAATEMTEEAHEH
ncbi:MAG: hypothetical protein ABL903_15165 [Methylococcales bacterium]